MKVGSISIPCVIKIDQNFIWKYVKNRTELLWGEQLSQRIMDAETQFYNPNAMERVYESLKWG